VRIANFSSENRWNWNWSIPNLSRRWIYWIYILRCFVCYCFW